MNSNTNNSNTSIETDNISTIFNTTNYHCKKHFPHRYSRTLHNRSFVVCEYCEKKFSQYNSYLKHRYKHHPFWNNNCLYSDHEQALLIQSAELLLSLKRPEVYATNPLVDFSREFTTKKKSH